MGFVWFWTFWHWSRENFLQGTILRGPLDSAASNWDEWFNFEASAREREAVLAVGENRQQQENFVEWISTRWAEEAGVATNRLAADFMLEQLAPLPPFNSWGALQKYREPARPAPVSAIVLQDASTGRASDVRPLASVLLPASATTTGRQTVSEGFRIDASELEAPRNAALSLLHGSGSYLLFSLWTAVGHRPHATWARALLTFAWAAIAAIILYLLYGPEPGSNLPLIAASLLGTWAAATAYGIAHVVRQILAATQSGKTWAAHLKRDQLRLTLNGDLTLRGGSAGLAFSLGSLASVWQAYPDARSWLWCRVFERLCSEKICWAATGVVTQDGLIKPVAVRPKIAACKAHGGITHLLTPCQRDATQSFGSEDRAMPDRKAPVREQPKEAAGKLPLIGYASEVTTLRIHHCWHLAQAVFSIGGMKSWRQIAMNLWAVGLSGVVLAALPDLLCILYPPTPPTVVSPSSPSPYFLWVSVETPRPEFFQAVFESRIWANRRADFALRNGAPASIRAEIRLVRTTTVERQLDDGTIWIERRARFLSRKFSPSERVGRYSFQYLSRLPDE